ncbi:MAG: hypothetical protein QM756_45490 [Polyangiaceae bacterium]
MTARANTQRAHFTRAVVRRGTGALLALGLALPCAPAHAEGGDSAAKPFRVVYSSSTSCTDPHEFSTRLQAMTSHFRPAVGAELSHTFFVHLTATQAGAHGQLGVLEPSGGLTLREVETADCHTLITALAFIGAVMADPLTPPPEQTLPARLQTLPPQRERLREQAQSVRPWRVAVGPGFGFDSGLGPELAPSLSVHAELSHVTGELDPSARLSFRVARTTASAAAGRAEFTLESGRLALCPIRTQPLSWLDVRPCAFADAGSLQAQGFATVQNKQGSLFWSAAGLELLLAVARLGPLTLGAEGGAALPFRHDGFYFDTNPDAPIHTIPTVVATASLSLSLKVY